MKIDHDKEMLELILDHSHERYSLGQIFEGGEFRFLTNCQAWPEVSGNRASSFSGHF